jgi:alpha-D-xyloside xylohydrolase
MDFNGDTAAINRQFEYMFGKSILAAPVTEPNITEWNVYLPESVAWYNFWTGKRFKGGQTIKTEAPIDRIPLFVRAGSIIPMGDIIQYAGEKPADTLEIRVYKGSGGKFDLYEDEGDNYNYEKGKYTIIPFRWDEQRQSLLIGDKLGNYKGSVTNRVFNVVFVNESEGYGITVSKMGKKVSYSGKKVEIKLKGKY